jgi:hypothetical protein
VLFILNREKYQSRTLQEIKITQNYGDSPNEYFWPLQLLNSQNRNLRSAIPKLVSIFFAILLYYIICVLALSLFTMAVLFEALSE